MTFTKAQLEAELKRRGIEPFQNSSFSSSMAPTQPSFSKEAIAHELQRRGIKVEEPSNIGQSLARGAKNVGAGLLEIPDLIASPLREGINLGAKALGSNYRMLPMSDSFSEGIDKLTGGYTSEKTPSHKTEAAITRSLASLPGGLGAASIVAKGAGKGAKALGNFLTQSSKVTPSNIAGTAATSGLMQESLNEDPENLLGAMGRGLIGGIGVSKMTSLPPLLTKKGREISLQNLGRNIGQKLKVSPSAIEDFYEAGINPTLVDVSTGKIPKMSSHLLGHLPGSSHTIEQAKDLQRKQILEGIFPEGKEHLSRAEASALTHKGAKAYHAAESSKHKKLFSQMEKDISSLPDTNVSPISTFKFLEDSISNFKSPKMYENFKKSPVGHQLMELHQEARNHNGFLPYEYLKEELNSINDKISTHGLIGKKSQGQLKTLASHIEKDIDRDLGQKLKSYSPDAYVNWKKAKAVYRQFAQEDIPNLNELYKSNKKGATDAFLNLITNVKKGAEKVKISFNELPPHEKIDLANSVHKHLGDVDGKFSALKWVRNFNKLDEPAKNILLSPLTKNRRYKLEKIADVMDHLRGTINEANTSKSGYYASLSALGGAGVHAIGSALHGNIFPAAMIGSGLLANKLGAEALTNPKVVDFIYNGMRMKSLAHFNQHLARASHIKDLPKTLVREAQVLQRENR